jgi:hypothetical protein
MTQTQNPGAVPPARGVPKGLRSTKDFGIAQPRQPLQAAIAKKRRRISPSVWGTVRARIAREHEGLPLDSPRRRPTLPKLHLRESA